jgi:UDP-glucose 4-epimerase
MSRILVTGATGRLGANLVRALLADGHQVVGVAVPNDPQRRKLVGMDLQVVEADLRDASALRQATAGCDAVVHTAALMNDRSAGLSRADFYAVNVLGTFAVFDAAAAAGVERLVYVSSTAAYDVYTGKPQPLAEDAELTPTSLYGLTKVVNERAAAAFDLLAGLKVIALRPNYIMAGDEALGPWTAGVVLACFREACDDPRMAMYVPGGGEPWRPVEAQIKSPGDLVVPRDTDGLSWRWHVCDVRDCVQACLRALKAPDACFGKAYNVVGPEPADWDVVVPYLAEKLGREWYEVAVPKAWRFWFDLTRAREELGFEPRYGPKAMIDDGLRVRAGEDIGVIPAAV